LGAGGGSRFPAVIPAPSCDATAPGQPGRRLAFAAGQLRWHEGSDTRCIMRGAGAAN
jgi:hypothetical protein